MTDQSEGCRRSAALMALVGWHTLSVKNKAYGGCSAERAEAGTVRLWSLPSYTADSSHLCPRIRVFSRKPEAISSVPSPPLMQTVGAVHACQVSPHAWPSSARPLPSDPRPTAGGSWWPSLLPALLPVFSNPLCPLPPRAFALVESLSRQLFPQMLSRSSHLLLCLSDDSRVSPRVNALGGSPRWQCKR